MSNSIEIVRLGDRALRFPRPRARGGGRDEGPGSRTGCRTEGVPGPALSARAIVRAAMQWPGALDVVVAREDVAVYFDREPPLDVVQLDGIVDEPVSGIEHLLRVVYDGADLEEVARATNLSVAEVIERHACGTYIVDTMGFAPGFAYLDGLDPALELPRRATPRERVPANSLAIAGTQTAVYPLDSPGGWHLIGRVVDVRMIDANGPLLALGDRVRFVT